MVFPPVAWVGASPLRASTLAAVRILRAHSQACQAMSLPSEPCASARLGSSLVAASGECRRLTLPSSGQSKGCALRLPLMSNVGRHKEPVSESPASCRCFKAVKASSSVRACTGRAAHKSNAYASSKARRTPFCRGCKGRWLFPQTNNTCFLPPLREGLSSSVSAGAGAPPKANVSQSVGAAAQCRSARPSRHGAAQQRGRWRSIRTSLSHRR